MKIISKIEAGTLVADCICAVVVMGILSGVTCVFFALISLIDGKQDHYMLWWCGLKKLENWEVLGKFGSSNFKYLEFLVSKIPEVS